jgi:hypothetical protein
VSLYYEIINSNCKLFSGIDIQIGMVDELSLNMHIVGDVCALSITFAHMVETWKMHRYMFRKVDSIGFFVLYSSSRFKDN